jgi:hypothetical protein
MPVGPHMHAKKNAAKEMAAHKIHQRRMEELLILEGEGRISM